MARPPVSVTLITLNEEKNIKRAIESVLWADEILVVDSGSTDNTVEIANSLGARVIQNTWSGYGQQKNFAQEKARFDWIFSLDADECVTPKLRLEIELALESSATKGIQGFKIPRLSLYLGRWIRHGGWYPNYLTRLAHRGTARWTEPEVHEELEVIGQVEWLKEPMQHFSFNGIQDQIQTNLRFSWLGYLKLRKAGKKPNLLKLILKPIGKFIETYFLKRGFLDGLPGFIISVNAAHSMFLKYSYFYQEGLADADPNH